MSYKIPAPKNRSELEQLLSSARRRVEWTLRVSVTSAIVAISGLIGFVYIPDYRSFAADIAANVFVWGGIVFAICMVIYLDNKHTRDKLLFQLEEDDKRLEALQSINSVQNQDLDKDQQPIDEWIENRVRPLPQPYGVSDEGAEHLTAQWLQYLGFEEATVTQYSGDGGIDVETLDYVCQVKNYRDKSVSVTEVRELFGVAASERKRAILFTSTGATTQAIEFADKNGIALIRFDAKSARLEEINDDGSDLLVNGEYEEA